MIREFTLVPGFTSAWETALSGKIMGEESLELEQALQCIVAQGARFIILDLSEVVLIDTLGWSAVITALKTIRVERRGELILHSVPEMARRILTITRIEKFVHIGADRAAALARLRTHA